MSGIFLLQITSISHLEICEIKAGCYSAADKGIFSRPRHLRPEPTACRNNYLIRFTDCGIRTQLQFQVLTV
jgi:hypothetical protein